MIYRTPFGVVCGACDRDGCAHETAVTPRDWGWLPDLPDLARDPFWCEARPGYVTRWVPTPWHSTRGAASIQVLVATYTVAIN